MKSKQTFFKIGMMLILVVCMLLALTACDEDTCLAHIWGNWTTAKEATCSEAGSAERICSICGHKEVKELPKLDEHTWGEWETITPATCAEAGKAERSCTVCQEKESKDLPVTETHSYGDWIVVTEAGCTTAGEEKQVCSVCQKEEKREIPAAHKPGEAATCTTDQICTVCKVVLVEGKHSYTSAVTAPTCTEDGYTTHTCSKCNDSYQDTPVAAAGHKPDRDAATCKDPQICTVCKKQLAAVTDVHTWGDWSVKTPAGCENDGEESRTCSVCQKSETRTITGGHKPGDAATCTTDQICTVCKKVLVEGKHNYSAVVTDPTCTEDGYTTHTCSKCGDSYKDTSVAASGHKPDCESATCFAEQLCSKCGEVLAQKTQHNHQLDATLSTPAGCLTAGEDVYVCQNQGCTDSYTVPVDATGHKHELISSTQQSCETDATETYACACGDTYTTVTAGKLGHDYSKCKEVEGSETLISGCTYSYLYRGICPRCETEVEQKQEAIKHIYSATITTEATCRTDGVKTYQCQNCVNSYTEAIKASDAHHVYDDGVISGNVITYTCKHCNHQITKINAQDKTEATVPADDLKQTGEIELKDASIALDDGVKNGLSGNVELKAETVTADALPELDANLKDAIGDSLIYNFGLVSGGEDKSQLGGEVTISVPYQLEDGEDPDLIAIWFIDSDGKVTAMPATYSNGFATFKTDHFSYYTVTRLTPAERCAVYGHSWMPDKVVAATCTEGGYTLHVCFRCGYTEKVNLTNATGHSMVDDTANSKPATCLTNGQIVTKCEHEGCDHKTVQIISATGHNMVADEENSVAATCTKNGKNITKCANEGCDHKIVKPIPATGHKWSLNDTKVPTCQSSGYEEYCCENTGCEASYKKTLAKVDHQYEAEVTAPTCTEDGYTTHTCSVCSDSYKSAYTQKLGHNYEQTVVPPTCTENGYTTHTCSRCQDTYKDTEVPAKHQYKIEIVRPTCTDKGYTSYVCEVCQHSYTDSEKPALGHSYKDTVVAPTCTENGYTEHVCELCQDTYTDTVVPAAHKFDIAEPTCGRGQICTVCQTEGKPATGQHVRGDNGICTVCGAGCEHSYTATVVAPTCTEIGYTQHVCSICQHTYRDSETATVAHNYVNGACSACGKVQEANGFYLNLLESLGDGQWTIKLSDLEIVSSTLGGSLASNIVCQIADAELLLGKDAAGNLQGRLYADVTTYPVGFQKLVSSYRLTGALEDGVLYISMVQSGEGHTEYMGDGIRFFTYHNGPAETFYIRASLEDLVSSVMGSAMDVENPALVEWAEKDLLPLLNKLYDENRDLINRALEAVFAELFDVTDAADGGKVLTLSADKVNALAELLLEGSISEIVDHFLGANGYEQLCQDLCDLLDLTLNEAVDLLKDYGLDIHELRTVLDHFAAAMTDGEEETIEGFLNQISNGNIDIDLDDYLNDAEFMAQTVASLISKLSGKPAANFPGMIQMAFKQMADLHLTDLVVSTNADPNEVAQGIAEAKKMIAAIMEGLSFAISTTEEGALTAVSFSMDCLIDVDSKTSGDIKLSLNLTSGMDASGDRYTKLMAQVNELNEKVNLNLKPDSVTSDRFIFDEQGNLIGFNDVNSEVRFENTATVNGQQVQIRYIYESGYFYTLDSNAATSMLQFTSDCKNWYEINVGNASYQNIRREYVSIYDMEGNLLSTEVIEDRINHSGTSGFSFYLNASTGEISYNGSTGHRFVLDESKTVTADTCEGISKMYYTCENCGETRESSIVRGHIIEEEILLEEGKTCADGYIMVGTCATCEEEIYRLPADQHDYTGIGTWSDCHSINVVYCTICGDCKEYSIGWHYGTAYPEIEQPNTNAVACARCGLTDTVQTIVEDLGNCNVLVKEIHTLINTKGEVLYTYTVEEALEQHNEENTTVHSEVMNPELGCEGGIYMTYVCGDCNRVYAEGYEFEHCEDEPKNLDLSKYNVCGNHFAEITACICGECVSEIHTDLEDMEPVIEGNNVMYATCPDCGLQLYMEATIEQDTCTETTTIAVSLRLNGEILVEMDPIAQKQSNHHSVKLVGFNADKTAMIFKEACSVCGEVIYQESYPYKALNVGDCDEFVASYDTRYYSFVMGEKNLAIWADAEYISLTLYDSQMNRINSAQMGIILSPDALKVGELYLVEVRGYQGWNDIITLRYDDPTQEPDNGDDSDCEHKYQTYHLLNKDASSCEDGTLTIEICTLCYDISYVEYNTWHNTVHRELDLSDYNVCDKHSIMMDTCLCGMQGNIKYDGLYNRDENGELYCDSCDLRVYDVSEQQREGCLVINTRVIRITVDSTVIEELVSYNNYTDHNIGRNMTLINGEGSSCNDGVRIQEFCRDCGEQLGSWTNNGHITNTEYVDLTALEGVCEYHSISHSYCACGENQSVYFQISGMGSMTSQACSKCGLGVTVTDNTTRDDECHVTGNVTYLFTYGDTELKTISVNKDSYEHEWRDVYELMTPGTSCEDGVWRYTVCEACGAEADEDYREEIYWHNSEYYWADLSESGCCDDHWIEYEMCPCGYEFYFKDDGNYDLSTGKGTYGCSKCGLTISYMENHQEDGCYIYEMKSLLVAIDGKIVVDKTFSTTRANHEEQRVLTLMNPDGTCEDGVTVTYVCVDCGKIGETYTAHDHERAPTEVDLSVLEGCCGYHHLVFRSCACGQNQYVDFYINSSNHVSQECSCGLKVIVNDDTVTDENCHRTGTVNYVFLFREELVFETTIYVDEDAHVEKTYVQLMIPDSTCKDGVIITTECTKCGKQFEQYEEYGHYTVHNEVDFSSVNNPCGHNAYVSSCACGENSYYNMYFYGMEQVEGDVTTTTCRECGIMMQVVSDCVVENCYRTGYDHVAFYTASGDLIGTLDIPVSEEKHHVERSYELLKPEGTCEAGVRIVDRCTECGRIDDEYTAYHHTTYTVKALEDIPCDYTGNHYIRSYTCPCGQIYDVDMNFDYSEPMPDKSYKHACYGGCGIEVYETQEVAIDGCHIFGNTVYTIYQNGEQRGVFEVAVDRYSHGKEMIQAVLPEGVTSCEEGVLIQRICADCGKVISEKTYTYHYQYSEEVDLSGYEDICSGHHITAKRCACGKAMYVDYYIGSYAADESETGTKKTCSYCGLTLWVTDTTVTANCMRSGEIEYRFTYGDQEVACFTQTVSESAHQSAVRGELAEGAVDCGGGVRMTEYCTVCSETLSTYTNYGHITFVLETVEIPSVCGAVLEKYGCCCERSVIYRLNSEKSNCVFDDSYIEGGVLYTCCVTDPACGYKIYVEDIYIHDEANCMQYRQNNWYLGYNPETGSYDALYSVTRTYGTTQHTLVSDSQDNVTENGVVISQSGEHCSVCQYAWSEICKYDSETWNELYYERKEVTKDGVTTSEVRENAYNENKCLTMSRYYRLYSDGSVEESTNTYEYNASNLVIRSYSVYRNSDGSTGTIEYLYSYDENGNRISENYSDIRSDGYASYSERTWMYRGDRCYDTMSYDKTVYPDGSENWYRVTTEYTFDENGCRGYRVEENSGGDRWEKEFDTCEFSWQVIQEPTCTQPGLEGGYCVGCGRISEDTYTRTPHGHYYEPNWDKEEVGFYCTNCGMENFNGVDGEIWLEDLTDEYGMDLDGNVETYYAGYYMAYAKGEYVLNVSIVIPAEAADAEETVVLLEAMLDQIFDDGVSKVSFNRADVLKAAAAAGYADPEAYDIRLSFVPFGGSELDYSITFTA